MLTLLTLTRGFKLEEEENFQSIEDPWLGSDTIIESELTRAFKNLGIRPGNKLKWSEFHYSAKKGPQGQALLSSMSELTLLPRELLNDIISIGGSKLGEAIESNLEGLDVLEFVRPADFHGVYFSVSS